MIVYAPSEKVKWSTCGMEGHLIHSFPEKLSAEANDSGPVAQRPELRDTTAQRPELRETAAQRPELPETRTETSAA